MRNIESEIVSHLNVSFESKIRINPILQIFKLKMKKTSSIIIDFISFTFWFANWSKQKKIE